MTEFRAPELRPRRGADGGEPTTWRCICGHPLSRHALHRVTGKAEQEWGGCADADCPCEHGVPETEAAAS